MKFLHRTINLSCIKQDYVITICILNVKFCTSFISNVKKKNEKICIVTVSVLTEFVICNPRRKEYYANKIFTDFSLYKKRKKTEQTFLFFRKSLLTNSTNKNVVKNTIFFSGEVLLEIKSIIDKSFIYIYLIENIKNIMQNILKVSKIIFKK